MTTQAFHGRDTHFELENLAGALIDISNQVKSIDFPEEAELVQVTAFKDTGHVFIPGLVNRKLSFDANYTSTLYTQIANMLGKGNPTGGTTNIGFRFVYGPEGNASGKIKITGFVMVAKNGLKPSVSDAIPQTVELQVTGGVTLSTFA
jgi:hypothetical protein